MKALIKFLFATFCLLLSFHCSFAQDTSAATGNFNMMKAPANPAFELMGINPTDIITPTDPTDFSVSVLNATDNFSAVPQNFAMSFAPGWVFAGRQMKWDDFVKGRNSFLQTLTVSAGTSTSEGSDPFTQTAFGLNFSIVRGNLDTSKLSGFMNSLKNFNDFKMAVMAKARLQNMEYRNNEILLGDANTSDHDFDSISKRNSELDSIFAEQSLQQFEANKEKIDKESQKLDFTRKGLNVAVSMGTVIDYPGQSFQYARASKVGGWVTTSYTDDDFDGLFLLRGLYNPDQVIEEDDQLEQQNIFNLDLGGKFNYRKGKFSIACEGIFRFYPNVTNPASTYKAVVNVNYTIAANKMISFTYGKDFDGTVTKANNLISTLNLFLGFGSNR